VSISARPWVIDAACQDVPTSVFYPSTELSDSPEADVAKRICGMCPVRRECREWAIKHRQFIGIWGGTTGRWRQQEYERRKYRRRKEGAA
jgi:WhiB family transcriptional regulator, redox-sensing transcriptional regulator